MTTKAILEKFEPALPDGLFRIVTIEAIATAGRMEATREFSFSPFVVAVDTQPNVRVIFIARNLVTGQTIRRTSRYPLRPAGNEDEEKDDRQNGGSVHDHRSTKGFSGSNGTGSSYL